MTKSAQESDRLEHVVAIASGQDPKRLRLSAAEGYLLSRIDGRTAWRLLREIGGIPPQDVDACLDRWLAEGVLELVGGPSKARPSRSDPSNASPAPPPRVPTDAASVPRAAVAAAPIDPRLLDPSLDIDCDVQRRILEFELSLSRPYHELLGVPVGADPKVVKRAYFKLSKEFHPDRYFRRQIGPYSVRLERIFKKVLEAHEILSDPDLCQLENQGEAVVAEAVDPALDAAGARPNEAGAAQAAARGAANVQPGVTTGGPAVAPASAAAPTADPVGAASASSTVARAAAAASPATSSPSVAPEAKKPLTKLERLKQRMPFKIDQAAFAARRARAREIFQAAEASLAAGRLHEAEANIRIAITFDPARAEFKEALGALRIRAAGDRAAKLLETPTDRMSEVELREVLRLLEDVLPYRPHDADLNVRAAGVCLRLGKHDEAVEYVETLLETAPDVAGHHSLRGRIERDRGNLVAARAAFEKALSFDREDLEARRALASMRIAAHDAARGGRR